MKNISGHLTIAQTWFDWVAKTGSQAQYELENYHSDIEKIIIGYLIQACAEKPDDFKRVFEPILGNEAINPLTLKGEGDLLNLVFNGIGDDWEIFLQWRESGYVVVNEGLRQPQDARLNTKEAIMLLDTITGGPSPAPGIANEADLIQSMYAMEGSTKYSPSKRTG